MTNKPHRWFAAGLLVCGLGAAVTEAAAAPPTVTVTAPAASTTVYGGIQVAAAASDDVGVAGVTFFVDGVALGAEDLTARARDTSGATTLSAPVTVTVNNDGSPAQVGQWGPNMTWPLITLHMSLLRTGELLLWDSHVQDAIPMVWNSATQLFTTVPNDTGLFCAGNAQMADGRVFTAGGHPYADEQHSDDEIGFGITDTNAFSGLTRTWTRLAHMRFPRWYPTVLSLGDGRLLAFSGQMSPTLWADTPELYDPATDTWQALPWVDTHAGQTTLYINTHLLPDGRVLTMNPEDGNLRLLDVANKQWAVFGNLPQTYSVSAMYRPGQVLVAGGSDGTNPPASTTLASVIDFTLPVPAWRATTRMRYGRFQHNLVALPDGRVLVVGGSSIMSNQSSAGVLAAELWDPATEAWTTLPEMADLRMYHSTALLLPDGRVLSAGGGRAGGFVNNFTAQFYSPAYLFKGTRPVITTAPATLTYGGTADVATPDAASITSAALISLGANTHTLSMGQRYVPLAFSTLSNAIRVNVPSDQDLLPPGFYMLFLFNGNGVPAVAPIVQVPVSPVPPLPAEAFQESGGEVVMEVEHYDQLIPRAGQSWPVEFDLPGFSRTAYLRALPDNDLQVNAGYVGTSPELVFRVKFETTGTYYVWLRGAADGGSDDSAHAGLDGSGPASADRISGFGTGWTWRRTTMDASAPATLNVATPGLHTVHLWMREDGLRLDKVLLRTSTSSTAPSGIGPAESRRILLEEPPPPTEEAFQEAAGQVVIEAEHVDANTARNGKTWTLETATSGFGGTGYMTSLPNTGTTLNTGYTTTSPELAFDVNFTSTGTYHVWVRGRAATGSDDSLHAGLDGAGPASADKLSGFGTGWTWRRTTMDASAPATLSITTPGLHTIHLWMREDGLKVDRLLLRKSTSSTPPSGIGPAESPRQ